MRRFRCSRLVVVLALAAALGTPPVWGQPDRHEATSAFNQLWNLFASLWEEAGCIIDPHGGCEAAGGPAAGAGCGLDPHGRCSDSPSRSFAEEGCIIDPHGGCGHGQSLPAAGAGCGADPHGGCSH